MIIIILSHHHRSLLTLQTPAFYRVKGWWKNVPIFRLSAFGLWWILPAGHASTYLLFPLRIGQFFTFLLPGISKKTNFSVTKRLQNALWQNTAE